jgi:hypothetical protein
MTQPRPLEDLRIARPCPARWEDMQGDHSVRFCGACRKNVYNLSALSRADATALVAEHEGQLCGVLYRRADGTVLTADCPVGRRAFVLRLCKRAAAAAAVLFMSLGGRYFTPEIREKSPAAKPDLPPMPSPSSPGRQLSPADAEMLKSLGSLSYID